MQDMWQEQESQQGIIEQGMIQDFHRAATSFGDTGGYAGAILISYVTEWGTIGITSLQGAFTGATNLVYVPSTILLEIQLYLTNKYILYWLRIIIILVFQMTN